MSFFAPYEGKEPYIFVSYAHADSQQVMDVICDMHSRGYRIWYDEGIEVGSEWPECIAEHLRDAHLMLAFISPAYMKSDNCRREMHYALMKRIKVINIFLENTEMTPGMEMQIGNIFALMKYTMSRQVFFDKLYAAPLLNSEAFAAEGEAESAAAPAVSDDADKKRRDERDAEREERAEAKRKKAEKRAEEKAAKPENKPENKPDKKPKKKGKAGKIVGGIIALVIIIAVIVFAIIGHFTGVTDRLIVKLNTEEIQLLPSGTKAEFTSGIFEDIARDFSGISSGDIYVSDLAGLTELYISGDSWYFTAEEYSAAEPAGTGSVRDLSDLQYFTGLRTLVLNSQSLSTLTTMPSLAVQYLDISNSRVASLEGIGKLTKLRELRADGCPITDLGDIKYCLELRLADLNGASVTDFSAFKPLTKLTSFSASGCTTDELQTILHHSSLTEISLYNCDLRGSFFRSFDRESNIVSITLDHCTLDSVTNLDDFSGLTTLTLISSGEALDWSELSELSALTTVTADAAMEPAISRVLGSSRTVTVNIVDAAE